MNRELFGTDGVRGLAGEYPLDSEGAKRIGMAVGAHFAQPGQQIVIGQDPRQSSSQLAADVTAGLTAVGVNVVSVGVIPTPGLAYLTREGQDFIAGVMITASHNPYQYNGVKVFDRQGDKLTDETEVILNKLIVDGAEQSSQGSSLENTKLVKAYEDFLVASAGGLQFGDLALAIDSANGAASGLAKRVFNRLGTKVTPLFDKPDGLNINAGCGATDPSVLQQTVKDQHLAMGVALDGDADRVALVDEKGRSLNGDHIMYILAVANKLNGIVLTDMTNLGAEHGLTEHDVNVERTRVGDRYVLGGLQRTGFKLGGEQAGHIILPDLIKTGDGLLVALQTIKAVHNSGKSLAQWRDEVKLLPQALVNIELTDKSKLVSPAVKTFIAEQTDKLGSSGRLLIRPSGTEPLARVMVEAPDAENLAKQIAAELKEIVA